MWPLGFILFCTLRINIWQHILCANTNRAKRTHAHRVYFMIVCKFHLSLSAFRIAETIQEHFFFSPPIKWDSVDGISSRENWIRVARPLKLNKNGNKTRNKQQNKGRQQIWILNQTWDLFAKTHNFTCKFAHTRTHIHTNFTQTIFRSKPNTNFPI